MVVLGQVRGKIVFYSAKFQEYALFLTNPHYYHYIGNNICTVYLSISNYLCVFDCINYILP